MARKLLLGSIDPTPKTKGKKMSSNVVSLGEYKKNKFMLMPKQKLFYLSKTELLEQLVSYYEAVKKDPFSLSIALWGEDLMEIISMKALTKELQDLADQHKKEGPRAAFKMD
ncbi:MAG: hypothetical protein HYW85_06055 [Deltaproteobacteria bacterium]|nr:hypothetical protein [Deltaproteobacteria bacterium]MBI3017794.1 hypothetical protein [Deltaproteobacteria bacterium]